MEKLKNSKIGAGFPFLKFSEPVLSGDEVDDYKTFDLETKISNFPNIRATDLPTVQRLYPPKPSTIRREIIMQNVKQCP